jgi:predicted Fe-Mo cluster-binding NifX family protein
VIKIKVAVSSTGKNLNSDVDNVFGRCPYFIIAEIENKKIIRVETIKNTSADKMSGAGISAAQTVTEKNVSAVITGNLGPRALSVLKQFNIKIYMGNGSVKKVLQGFIEGKLNKVDR